MSLSSNNCRVCHSSELVLKFTIKHCKLERCKNCGFVQVANKPREEQLNEIYSESYFSHSKYQDLKALAKEDERRFKIIQKYIPAGTSRILDAGCAGGEFISYVKGSYEMWGVDLSTYAIEKAKAKNPELKQRLFAGYIEHQNFEADFFDGIVLWDVIEHVWEPRETIEQLLKYIKPGGYLLISTPNIGASFAKVMGKYWPFMTPPEHLSFLTKKSFTVALEGLNAKVVSWRSKGKWANIGFILYKIRRIAPVMMPEVLIRLFQKGLLKKLSAYVPTGDVQYISIRKGG